MNVGALRFAAVALAEYACGRAGRSKDDPVYTEVTEGRDSPPNRRSYSSCGDLGHWLLYRLGCREKWVNREAAPGGYRSTLNVSLLAAHGEAPGGSEWEPAPGDVLIIANQWPSGKDAHVCVWLGDGRVANYGAGGMSAAATPGANVTTPALSYHGGGWHLGTRRVQRYVSLERVPLTAKPDLSGAELTGEVIDALTLENHDATGST